MSSYTARNLKIILLSSFPHFPHPISNWVPFILSLECLWYLFSSFHSHSYLVCPSFLTWIITYSFNWSPWSNTNMIYITPLFKFFQQFLIAKLLGMAWHTKTSVIWSQKIYLTSWFRVPTSHPIIWPELLIVLQVGHAISTSMLFLIVQALLKCP